MPMTSRVADMFARRAVGVVIDLAAQLMQFGADLLVELEPGQFARDEVQLIETAILARVGVRQVGGRDWIAACGFRLDRLPIRAKEHLELLRAQGRLCGWPCMRLLSW
jgi:hypothetical protein